MKEKPSTAVVALSGGLDSSLAAALLKEDGFEVTGLHFLLPAPLSRGREKMLLVERIAEHLRIPLSFLDLRDVFDREVVTPFTDAYLDGLTPNPCVICNLVIKFDHLIDFADKGGIEYISTGHYARIGRPEGGAAQLRRGIDGAKEQSYVLCRLRPSHLARTLFPLGDVTKKETRRLNNKMGLPSASQPESQEICFIPGNDYRLFVENRKGRRILQKGPIVDRGGRIVGEHLGTYRFTIGQRHGLGIASPRPYYVMETRPATNEVLVGRKEDLFSGVVEAEDFNWLIDPVPTKTLRASAQIRYRHRAAPGRLEVLDRKRVRFEFDEPQWALTPGQALVLYDGDRVMGGGWITKA
jgi:tRNA-specific 2-thiouridylase